MIGLSQIDTPIVHLSACPRFKHLRRTSLPSMRIPNAIAVYSSVAGMHTAVREAIERSPLRDALATVPVLDVDKADPAAPSSPLRTAEVRHVCVQIFS